MAVRAWSRLWLCSFREVYVYAAHAMLCAPRGKQGHMASLRAIYSYFMDIPLEDVPYLSFPLHTAVCLTEMPYGMEEKVSLVTGCRAWVERLMGMSGQR